MIRRIDARNFCRYLALTNLVSYNLGYHVHEKAIMLTIIPLAVELFMNQHSKDEAFLRELRIDLERFKLLKLLQIWSYLVIFLTMRDLLTRITIVLVDWIIMSCLFEFQLRKIKGKGVGSLRESIYKVLVFLLCLCFLTQSVPLRQALIS
jgi:hypothetical protein